MQSESQQFVVKPRVQWVPGGGYSVTVSFPGTFTKASIGLSVRMVERARYHMATVNQKDTDDIVRDLAVVLQTLLASLDGFHMSEFQVVLGHLKTKMKEFEEITNTIKGRSPIPVTVLPPVSKD